MSAKNPFEVPGEMRDLASRSVEQARKAFDTFIDAANKASSSLEGGSNPVQKSLSETTKRTVGYAERNVGAAFDLAEKLVQAKTLEEVMKIQTEFMQSQVAALQTQMKEAGEVMQKQFSESASAMQNMGKKK